MPARQRATNSIVSDVASANSEYESAEPISPTRMIGLRPMRSDKRPQNGENRNCISENDVESRPDHQRRRAEVLRVERQQRNDDPEAEQIDEDRDEDDQQRRHSGQVSGTRRRSDALEAPHRVRKAVPDRHAAEVRAFGAARSDVSVADDARRTDVAAEPRVPLADLRDLVHRGEVDLFLRVEARAKRPLVQQRDERPGFDQPQRRWRSAARRARTRAARRARAAGSSQPRRPASPTRYTARACGFAAIRRGMT